jgi:hypothetical protein
MATKTPQKPKQLSQKEAETAAKALEALFASEYVDKKKLYIANFWRGLFFSVGGILGAAIIISLLLWLLSLLHHVPLVGPVFDNIKQSVQQQETKK